MAFQSCFLYRQVHRNKSIHAEGDYRLYSTSIEVKKIEIITFLKHALNWSLQE